jgi:hypothetical protein
MIKTKMEGIIVYKRFRKQKFSPKEKVPINISEH